MSRFSRRIELLRSYFGMLLVLTSTLCLETNAVAIEPQTGPTTANTAPKNSPTLDEAILFAPAKFPEGDWMPAGLDYEDIYFESRDGTRLHGWFLRAENPRCVVVLMHGNAGNVATRVPWLRYLHSHMRLTIFAFDYRGYGRSEGVATVKGAIDDATAAVQKASELTSIDASEIVLMGESLGGAIAIQVAAEQSPKALILQSTFSSFKDVATKHAPALAWMVPSRKLNSVSAIKRYHGPLLQSHGDRDKVIPVTLGRQLFEAANEPKTLVALDGVGHNNWITPTYLSGLDEFIEKLADR